MASSPEVSIPQQHLACTYDHPGSISTAVSTLDTPAPGPGELLVKLTHSGVCHSDLGVMENSVWWTSSFGVFLKERALRGGMYLYLRPLFCGVAKESGKQAPNIRGKGKAIHE
jgi:threonine dehydrogenase-like Zn-dependent dehydrogenase